MKIQQEDLRYKPITIKFDKQSEAEALLGIMEKICDCFASHSSEVNARMITEQERKLAIGISNAFTNETVRI